MIFGNIRQEETNTQLPENIKECLNYALSHDLSVLEKGSYPIDGKRLFVNIVEYETTLPENRFWEAHREYLDVHYMLDGQEQIDLNFIQNMEQKEFEKENDFLPLEGSKSGHITLKKEDFLVCYPDDAHRTALQLAEPEKVKKAIFKIRV